LAHLVDPTLRDFHVKVYAAIREVWLTHGISPSQIELRDGVGCSITTVLQAIRELTKRGYITTKKFESRSIQLTDWDRTISNKPLDPWDNLRTTKFFKDPEWGKEKR
jgi:DNA-binding transcriptional MocR family regulator